MIHHEDKFKVRSYSMYWPEGVAVLIPHEDNFKLRYVKILCTVLASFDPHHEDKGWQFKLKLRSYSMYGPEGVAVLIPPGEKLRLRSYSMYWPEGMAVLSRMKIRNKS